MQLSVDRASTAHLILIMLKGCFNFSPKRICVEEMEGKANAVQGLIYHPNRGNIISHLLLIKRQCCICGMFEKPIHQNPTLGFSCWSWLIFWKIWQLLSSYSCHHLRSDRRIVGFASVHSPLLNHEKGTPMNPFLLILFLRVNLLWQIDSWSYSCRERKSGALWTAVLL